MQPSRRTGRPTDLCGVLSQGLPEWQKRVRALMPAVPLAWLNRESVQGPKDVTGYWSRLVNLVSAGFQVGQEKEAGLAESRQGGRKVFRVAAGRG